LPDCGVHVTVTGWLPPAATGWVNVTVTALPSADEAAAVGGHVSVRGGGGGAVGDPQLPDKTQRAAVLMILTSRRPRLVTP